MEAVAIPSGDNSPPVAAAAASSRRRRSLRATFLLFIAASASLLLILQSRPSSDNTAIIAFPTALQLKESLSATLSSVPRLGRQAFENTKTTAFSVKTFSAESAELAWEKSENAFHQLTGHNRRLMLDEKEEDGKQSRDNPLERALEGLEGIFHLHRRGADEEGNLNRGDNNNVLKKKNNLRKDRRNSNNKQQRNMKRREASSSRATGRTNNNRRNAKAEPSKQDENEEQTNNDRWIMSHVVDSPLAAPLLAFCGILFLMASLVMSPRRANSEVRNSNTVILDENEAEIVEFYEKEMECGTFGVQTIPFLQQDAERGVDEHHHPLKRQGSGSERWLMSSDSRILSDSSLLLAGHHIHRRSASDPLLTRHHVHPGAETRESHGDSYYSRVLQTLHYEEDEEDEEVQMDEGDDQSNQECQNTLLENVSSLTEEHVEEAKQVAKECMQVHPTLALSSPRSQPTVMDDEDTCFESTQSEEVRREQETETHRPQSQSPLSPSSSISSLTLEGCYIDAAFGGPSCQDNKSKHDGEASSLLHASTTIFVPGPEQVSKSLCLTTGTKSEYDDSHTCVTPPRSNLYQDRRQSLIKVEQKLSRRVSFSPEVKVCEIPRQTKQQQQHGELSSESYLYIMLFTVAIAIAVFSLMPAHPSLSPISSMTRGEFFERAETMLTSQWDVEL